MGTLVGITVGLVLGFLVGIGEGKLVGRREGVDVGRVGWGVGSSVGGQMIELLIAILSTTSLSA